MNLSYIRSRDSGRGGAKEISKVFGIHQNTLTAGKKDLHSGEVLMSDNGKSFGIRRKGAGRKTIADSNPDVMDALNKLMVTALGILKTH